MIDTDLSRRIRSLEVEVLARVDGLLHGDHRSLLPGPGSVPSEARRYIPGDDVRRMDWNVTARTRDPHVRDPEADRELETTLVVDRSGSMDFGTGHGEKADVALAAAAVFGFVTARGGNRVGGVASGARLRHVPPRSGRAHVARVLTTLAGAGGDGDLTSALWAVARARSRRGLIVVISDFLDQSPWERPMRMLASRHDVVAIRVGDPREAALPDVGVVLMEDTESGRQRWVDTSGRRFRQRYRRAAAERLEAIRGRLASSGVSVIELSTDEDWLDALVRWVVSSRRRRALAGRSA